MPETPLTELIAEAQAGNKTSEEKLFLLIYDDLKKIAARRKRLEGVGDRLQTTELVNDAYVSLMSGAELALTDRRHLFRVFAKAMEHLVIDVFRRNRRIKHGGGLRKVDDAALDMLPDSKDHKIAFEVSTLARLGPLCDRFMATHDRQADVFRLRVFAGREMQEIAELTGVSLATVERDWAFARIWLARELERTDGDHEN